MVVVVGFLLSEEAFGLLAPRSNLRTASLLYMSDSPAVTEFSRDPCWEDIYDDDCVMSSVAAASFVAGEWIKRMPCAAGLEVCNDSHDYLCTFDCSVTPMVFDVTADTFDLLLCLRNDKKDCDMPENLKLPETRPEAGIESVDVMSMLGLQRATPLVSSSKSKEEPSTE
jgi:hypothetical protein